MKGGRRDLEGEEGKKRKGLGKEEGKRAEAKGRRWPPMREGKGALRSTCGNNAYYYAVTLQGCPFIDFNELDPFPSESDNENGNFRSVNNSVSVCSDLSLLQI